MKKLTVPLIVVLLVAVGGMAYMLFFNKSLQQEPVKRKATYFTFTLEKEFITNVKNSQSLFKTSITFEIEQEKEEEQKAFLEENTPVIRDSILFLLREKTYDELRASDIRDKLSKQIVELLNEKLDVEYLKSVYFNEYVVQ